jgi:hypothetical protein
MLEALLANVLSWFVKTFAPSQLHRLVPQLEQEENDVVAFSSSSDMLGVKRTRCVIVGRPGGVVSG